MQRSEREAGIFINKALKFLENSLKQAFLVIL